MSDISVLSIDKGFKLESAFSEAFNSIKVDIIIRVINKHSNKAS